MTYSLEPMRHAATGYESIPQDKLLADPSISELLDMLTYCRPARGLYEKTFINRFLHPLGAEPDDFGNYWLTVDDAPILWSSHTDTVHREDGLQSVTVGDGVAYAEKSSCLGADDTAGVWLMMQMIRAGVSGTYVFHREEEVGGHGSIFVNRNFANDLAAYKCAIALDRKGYGDVLTHQMGSRCCSDAFAESLSSILGGRYAPDDGGVFTDTYHYRDNVGECVNISVGYHMQHGPNETLDLAFVSRLRDVLLAADWSHLVFDREPGEKEREDLDRYAAFKGYGYGGTASRWEDYDDEDLSDLAKFVEEEGATVAAYLQDRGVTIHDLEQFYFKRMAEKG